MTTTPLARLRKATDPWAQTEAPLSREDANRLSNAIHARINSAEVALNASKVEPDELGWESTDESAAVTAADGPLVTVEGYERYDTGHLLELAEWWDRLAAQASEVAAELRRQAASVCMNCDGAGEIGNGRGGERECPCCDGSGVVA